MSVRIAVLTSEDAPGLLALLADPLHGSVFEVTTVVSAGRRLDPCDVPLPEGVSVVALPISSWHRHRSLSPRNLLDRKRFDEALLDVTGDADFLFLDDYRYLVTPVLLDAFPGRIIVFHDGDLTMTANGRRSQAGIHAVRDAVIRGEPSTRATAFIATEHAGEGPLLLLGPSYPIAPLASAAVKRADLADITMYAALHRRWMVSDSFGSLLRRTAEMVSVGTLQIVQDTVWVDGVPGPCRLGEAPSACRASAAPLQRGIPQSCPFIQTEESA